MENNPVRDKSYKFALEIIIIYREIKHVEFVLAKQLLRSGTSVGANVEEAIGGQSEKDFLSKLMIAYRECRETVYWLSLLKDSNIVNRGKADDMIARATEILRIIGKIRSTINSKKLTDNQNK